MGIYDLISYIVVFFSLYFEIFFLLSYFGKKESTSDSADVFEPSVSIIIPCFNEEKSAIGTINSVLSLDYPKEKLQIIFIDDGSTDGTYQKVKDAFSNNPSVEIYKKENGGKYTALNFGIEKAKHNFIGSLDADSFVKPESLGFILEKFKDPKVMATVPSMVIHEPKSLVQKAQKAEYHYGNFIRNALALSDSIYVTPGPFSFFRREVFEKIGLYRHAYNTEDMEMALRMQKNGMKIAHAEKAVIYTLGPNSLNKLYKQRVRWATGFFGNLRDYREMFFKKRHGNLSLLVLPFITLGSIGMVVLATNTIWAFYQNLSEDLQRISIVGFRFSDFQISDYVYLNSSFLGILGLFLLLYAVVTLSIGNKLTSGKYKFNYEFFYMLFFYSFMYPLWLFKAIYNTLFSKSAPWR